MPSSQQPGEQSFDHFVLSDEDFAYLLFDILDRLHDARSCTDWMVEVYRVEVN